MRGIIWRKTWSKNGRCFLSKLRDQLCSIMSMSITRQCNKMLTNCQKLVQLKVLKEALLFLESCIRKNSSCFCKTKHARFESKLTKNY